MDLTPQELRHLHLKLVQSVVAEDSKTVALLLGKRHQYRHYRDWVTRETIGQGDWGPRFGRTPFAEACDHAMLAAIKAGSLELIKVLNDAGASPPSERWALNLYRDYTNVDYPYLMVAAKHGRADAMMFFLNQRQSHDDNLILKLANEALIRGHTDIFTRLSRHQYLKKRRCADLSLADSGNAARAATKAGQSGFDDLFTYLMNLVPLGERQQVAQEVYKKLGSLRILQHCLPLLDPGWFTRNQRSAFKVAIEHAPTAVIRYFLLQGERPVNKWIENALSYRSADLSSDGQTPEREESLLFLCELLDRDYPIQEYILSGAASRTLWRLLELHLSRPAFKIGQMSASCMSYVIKHACMDGKVHIVHQLLDMDSCPTHEHLESTTNPSGGHSCSRIKEGRGCSIAVVLNKVCCGFRDPQAMEVLRQVEGIARQRFVDTAINFADKWRFSGLGRYMIDLLSHYRLRPIEAIVRNQAFCGRGTSCLLSAATDSHSCDAITGLEKLPGCENILRPFLEEGCTYALEDGDELLFKIFNRVFHDMQFKLKKNNKWALAAINGGLASVVKNLLRIPYAVTYSIPPFPFTDRDDWPSRSEHPSQLVRRTWIMSYQAEPYHRAIMEEYVSNRGGLWLTAAQQCVRLGNYSLLDAIWPPKWDSEGETELDRSELLLDYAFAGNHLGLIKHMTSWLGVDCNKEYFLTLFLPKSVRRLCPNSDPQYVIRETCKYSDRQAATLEAIGVFLAGVDEYQLTPRLRPDFKWLRDVRARQSRICEYFTTTGVRIRKFPLYDSSDDACSSSGSNSGSDSP
ncbi:hypothetical protein DFS34DRAFT_590165 [Phlyctochytrium arcticum]|nr:hypothetical protein DFS34DRAFT_590165 [Phlyctochytrium arcticum]